MYNCLICFDDSNYNFLSYTAFITKYNMKTNYREYYKVVSALKHFRKKCSNNQNFTTLEKAADNLFSSEKVCKKIYQILVKRKTSSPVKSQGKWLAEDLFSNVQVNWENTYQLPFLCTTEKKLWVFQFKFLHTPDLFALISQRHLRISFGTVDQLRLFGMMFRSGPPKILT